MNAATYEALRPHLDVHYVGPIDPPFFYHEKIPSKLRRLAGRQGDFFFFSAKRLRAIASEVRARCRRDASLDFFHGFTPWVLTQPERPYVASSDCTFHDYIDIFHRRQAFAAGDVARIERAEAEWLKGASLVLLRSQWAADRAIRHYGLDSSTVRIVKSCGEMEMPEQDEFGGGNCFVFVSTNFKAKGGDVALAAFRSVRGRHPNASLIIVGDRPADFVPEPGVELAGLLHKEIPDEVLRFRAILAQARALVHPTNGDVSPLIIVEAGYFGCPAISSRSFAIPELVEDGSSGLLLDEPGDPHAVATAMFWMIDHDDDYRRMRKRTWIRSRSECSRSQFEQQVTGYVHGLLRNNGTPPI